MVQITNIPPRIHYSMNIIKVTVKVILSVTEKQRFQRIILTILKYHLQQVKIICKQFKYQTNIVNIGKIN